MYAVPKMNILRVKGLIGLFLIGSLRYDLSMSKLERTLKATKKGNKIHMINSSLTLFIPEGIFPQFLRTDLTSSLLSLYKNLGQIHSV